MDHTKGLKELNNLNKVSQLSVALCGTVSSFVNGRMPAGGDIPEWLAQQVEVATLKFADGELAGAANFDKLGTHVADKIVKTDIAKGGGIVE